MPDLTTRTIGSWLDPNELDGWRELPDAAKRADLHPSIETAVVALGVAIDEADARDPKGLSKRLRTDPPRSTFQSVLAELGSEHLLHVLDWLTEPGKPHREPLLAALFTPGAGDASGAIHKTIRMTTRRALVARMTADVRMSSLLICTIERNQDKDLRRKVYP